ncbi:unnamed protein product [Clavelina lepadiformis]|uniref:PH domain-containing protein n=1 Tax=Clavelina lepadiformis TaxID=159417 RepID=A0ABP0G096_CLALP
MAIPTLKAGWLLRQSTILKKWKRNWFVLYGDGNLTYYENDDRHDRVGNFSVPVSCVGIKTALECTVNPPEDRTYGCLLKFVSRENDHVTVCAYNSDEALAWKMMVEPFMRQHPTPGQPMPVSTTTRTTTVCRYPVPYLGSRYRVRQNVPVYYYPNHGPVQISYNGQGQPYYVHPHTQVVHVVREDDPYYYRDGSLVFGLAAGAMLGAAMWSPLWWF